MIRFFLDALIDSAKTIPILLFLYVGVELAEYWWGNKIREVVARSGKAGPIVGSIAGAFPQCGFSVIATALYTQRLVTLGTLLAVYLSTSDEAIPIILSRPDKLYLIWPIVGTKILIAVLAGYGIDFIFRKDADKITSHIEAVETGHDNLTHHHEEVLEETACCGHSTSCTSKRFNVKEIIWHPILHTFNIFGFIFVTTLMINILLSQFELKALNNVFLTALIGLIPNCAASVTLTELYLKNTIGFGPTIAGLSASGGLGLLILYRELKNKKTFIKILGLLYGISALAGIVVDIWHVWG